MKNGMELALCEARNAAERGEVPVGAVVLGPDGTVLAEHPTPANPTNCAFGDADRRSLYVTGYDGCLYRARTDLQG